MKYVNIFHKNEYRTKTFTHGAWRRRKSWATKLFLWNVKNVFEITIQCVFGQMTFLFLNSFGLFLSGCKSERTGFNLIRESRSRLVGGTASDQRGWLLLAVQWEQWLPFEWFIDSILLYWLQTYLYWFKCLLINTVCAMSIKVINAI